MTRPRLPNAPKCPQCSKVIDGYTAVSQPDAHPSPGDLSMCAYCGTPLQFTDEMTLEVVDVTTLPAVVQADIAKAQRAVRFIQQMKTRSN